MTIGDVDECGESGGFFSRWFLYCGKLFCKHLLFLFRRTAVFNFRRIALILVVGLALPSIVVACLWDSDTLQQERSRFPSTLELVTGKFLRHSNEFYEWRVQDRVKKLEYDPQNLAYYDDLGVAYDKIGENQKAIDTMLKKDRIKPGLYETEANLGTFLIHGGKLEEGLKHINRAIEMNSDAHFGREKYQKMMVEYILSRRKEGHKSLPLAPEESSNELRNRLLEIKKAEDWPSVADLTRRRENAVKGILGIMRFGNYDSPVVLELLGNVLSSDHGEVREDAKQLAARAYLKASYESKDSASKEGYRKLAEHALTMQVRAPQDRQMKLTELEPEFQEELKDASQWYAALREKEIGWIQDGKDPEAEFNRLYTEEPRIAGEQSVQTNAPTSSQWEVFLVIGLGIAVAGSIVAWRLSSRRNRAAGAISD